MIDTLIQDVPGAVAESQATEMTMSIWEMTLKGCSYDTHLYSVHYSGLYLFERYFAIRNASKEDPSLWKELKIIFMRDKLITL